MAAAPAGRGQRSPAHLAQGHDQGLGKQAPLVQVDEQSGQPLVEGRHEVVLDVVAVNV